MLDKVLNSALIVKMGKHLILTLPDICAQIKENQFIKYIIHLWK